MTLVDASCDIPPSEVVVLAVRGSFRITEASSGCCKAS